ncbi:SPOR domain-containing protein [Sulfuricurvum sp.]|uniref:SPOR domain-containing protein n=1 Tax=Sulfuricurvum sp. TaxID=2025608 RepID=UPI00260B6002|nr:SPOR domain-containing protein [Sulfuricurvum sp.]MDD2267288.1 SPOR domain-containing protein [Sulfuricurvum sp.]MDD2782589.1 SPOR domain-containing protein [Sulfuricurvum sp.]
MEEKNELNDIILNKSGSGSNSKKLLLAIAALTLILIIVLVIMNSLKTQTEEQPPHAAVPPTPSAPTEIVDDPLFEPVEVIQEGGNETSAQDLGKIAQKIKQESFQNTPAEQPKAETPNTPAPQAKTPAPSTPAPVAAAPKAEVKPSPAPKAEPKPTVVKSAPKAAEPVINTPTIKNAKPVEPKKVTETKKTAVPETKPSAAVTPKPAEKPAAKATADTEGTYFIQVGSFSKEPNKALFDRLNASGLKYITVPSGSATKVMVGPFQGEKAARDVLGTVRKNIEAGAYITGK